LSEILSASWLHSSLAVVAESASNVLVLPSMKVMGSMMGFLDLVALNYKKNMLVTKLTKKSSGIIK
jgi:hypothetical protein